MHTFILQEWTLIRGGVATVTQQETEWLDLTAYQDVVFFVDVRGSTSSPTLEIQTSPTGDESLFVPMITGLPMTGGSVPTVIPVFMTAATTPVARFVRWQITGTPTWDATFRIVVAANAPGL